MIEDSTHKLDPCKYFPLEQCIFNCFLSEKKKKKKKTPSFSHFTLLSSSQKSKGKRNDITQKKKTLCCGPGNPFFACKPTHI